MVRLYLYLRSFFGPYGNEDTHTVIMTAECVTSACEQSKLKSSDSHNESIPDELTHGHTDGGRLKHQD